MTMADPQLIDFLNWLRFHQAHEAVCECVKVPCVHSDCGELVTRAQLADHLEQRCQYRLETCEYCQAQVTFAVMKVCAVTTRYLNNLLTHTTLTDISR